MIQNNRAKIAREKKYLEMKIKKIKTADYDSKQMRKHCGRITTTKSE